MDSTNPRASKHAHGELGDHGHVDGHAVPFAHASVFQHIGHPTHFSAQLSVRNAHHLVSRSGLVALPDNSGLYGIISWFEYKMNTLKSNVIEDNTRHGLPPTHIIGLLSQMAINAIVACV